MFTRLPEAEAVASISLTVDGRSVRARPGDSVAAALLAAGFTHCRSTPLSGAKRAPYCMIGVCFECLLTIDGVGNCQGCLIRVREGMRVALQHGKRDAGA
jgi:D-hydroxyproline dehydrogenase subunit gamma